MKQRKLVSLLLVFALMSVLLAACAGGDEGTAQTGTVTNLGTEPVGTGQNAAPTVPADTTTPEKPKEEYTGPFGRLCGRFADTHETYVRNAASALCDAKGWTIDHAECNDDQVVMNDKLTLMYTKGYRAVICGLVNNAAADSMIQIARNNDNACIIFQKNEPNPIDEFNAYDNAFFCGSIYQQAGICEGQAIEKYMKAHPEWDKNKDGVLQYVMIMGTLGGMEVAYRTEYSIKYLTDNGVKVEKLFEDTAEWQRVKAMEKMQTWLTALNGKDVIEAVFANSDDMAAGAIEALKAVGYFAPDTGLYVPVVGVDATTVGRDFMREGSLLATSYNNPIALGEATVYLAHAVTNGLERTDDVFDGKYKMSDRDRNPDPKGKYVWLDYVYVDLDNLEEFEKVYIKS